MLTACEYYAFCNSVRCIWIHLTSQRCWKIVNNSNLMATVFWSLKGVLSVDFMEINPQLMLNKKTKCKHCATLFNRPHLYNPHLDQALKKWLSGHPFNSIEKLQSIMRTWLDNQAATLFEERIAKLVYLKTLKLHFLK